MNHPVHLTKFTLPLLLIIIAILARVHLFSVVPNHIVNPWDSIDYGWYGIHIVQQGRIEDIFNVVRPPVYPVLLALNFVITGLGRTTVDIDALYGPSGVRLALFQSIVGIISVYLLYTLLCEISGKKTAFFLSVFYAINPLVLPWDRYILTESLSISFIIFYLKMANIFFRKPSLKTSLLLVGMGLLCAWIRSVYLLLIPVTLVVFILEKFTIKRVVVAYFVGVLYMLPILGHMMINEKYYNSFSFQVMGGVNMFGRLLVHPYPISVLPNNRISSWMQKNYVPNVYSIPFPIFYSLSSDFYYDKAFLQELHDYNSVTISRNLLAFIRDCLRDLPQVFWVNGAIVVYQSGFIYQLQQIAGYIFAANTALFFLLPLVFISWFRHKTWPKTFTLLTGLLAAYLFISSVIYGYVDSSRYAIEMLSVLLLYGAGVFKMIQMWYITGYGKHFDRRQK